MKPLVLKIAWIFLMVFVVGIAFTHAGLTTSPLYIVGVTSYDSGGCLTSAEADTYTFLIAVRYRNDNCRGRGCYDSGSCGTGPCNGSTVSHTFTLPSGLAFVDPPLYRNSGFRSLSVTKDAEDVVSIEANDLSFGKTSARLFFEVKVADGTNSPYSLSSALFGDLTHVATLNVNTEAVDVGVEDESPACTIAPTDYDWGDATNSYKTLESSIGANHGIVDYDAVSYTSSLMIGDTIDAESNGHPNDFASGDDFSGMDDEDGVSAFDTLNTGTTDYDVNVKVTNTTGDTATLYGWIDFDCSGSFDPSEMVSTAVSDGTSGTVTLSWTGLSVSNCSIYYMRIRLTSDTLSGSDAGGSASDGEVEDYSF